MTEQEKITITLKKSSWVNLVEYIQASALVIEPKGNFWACASYRRKCRGG